MAKLGMNKKTKIHENTLEMLIKHINGEEINDSLLDLTYEFYGYINEFGICAFKIGFAGKAVVLEIEENPEDGYRSYFEGVLEQKEWDWKFSSEPLLNVNIERIKTDFEDAWVLKSMDGHVLLYFGTDGHDDYYPCFLCEYNTEEI